MAEGLVGALMAERDRWLLWGPVFLGIGIAVYFGWRGEPPVWPGGAGLVCGGAVAVFGRGRPALLVPALACLLVSLGFSTAAWRTARVAAPVLERPSGAVVAVGTVSAVEPLPDGGGRVTLDRVEISTLEGTVPTRVRLRFRPAHGLPEVGRRVSVPAVLIPPAAPVAPGAFDFRRKAWFMGLGAVGMALGAAETLSDPPEPPSWRERLALSVGGLRQGIEARIHAVLPGPEGGTATAILTGRSTGVSPEVLANYRDSGLAHILVIAGLHMGMVAGFVFLVVRRGLALVPAIALRWPTKKWAAVAALAVCGFYLVLAGLPLPATRAFIMAAVVLVAILLDRGALTMRLWALAATVILLTQPEEIAGPSFQMSFAAVAALIATYEVAGPVLRQLHRRWPGPLGRFGLHVGRLMLTSLAAGSATTVYAIYHFNRVAVWQVVANLVAVPITGVMVMPWAVVALVLMPFGLEALALVPMGWGLQAVGAVAATASHWPGAQLAVPVMPPWGLALFSLGGLWLCLWRGRWRLWGLPAMALGLASLALDRPPDILVDGRGQVFGVRMADGSLLMSSRGRFLRDTWGRRAGPASSERWPGKSRSADGRLSCDAAGCLYRSADRMVALVRDEDGLDEACAGPAVVVSAVPVRGACRGAQTVVDRFDLWRRGAHALWLEDGGRVRVDTVADLDGGRPWSLPPVPRRKPRAEEGGGPDKPEDSEAEGGE